ncbi:hypothetical protein OC844_004783 [Tilletia horrida]|nr:hypothetical protein OC844_004783 [Tilletia horrida]
MDAHTAFDRRYTAYDKPNITELPPVYVCLDCQAEPLIITTRFQVQAMIFFGSVIALLGSMTITLFLFANNRMLRSRIFWGSVAALTINMIAVCTFLVELMPGATPDLASQPYVKLTCARRFFTLITPWSWTLVLLGKLFAFYPRTIRQRKHVVLLSVLVALKFRVFLDIVSIGLLCGGINVKDGRQRFANASKITYFCSVCLDLVDSIIVTTCLLRTSFEFYKKARLRMSTNSRKIRLIFESIGMTFIGAIPPQIVYAFGLVIFVAKPHLVTPSAQYWVVLWNFASLGIFGVLSTVYSSIGNVPAIMASRHASPAQSGARADANAGRPSVEGGAGPGAGTAPIEMEPTETLLSIFFIGAGTPSTASSSNGSPASSSTNRLRREKEKPLPPGQEERPYELVNRRRRWLPLGRSTRSADSSQTGAIR